VKDHARERNIAIKPKKKNIPGVTYVESHTSAKYIAAAIRI